MGSPWRAAFDAGPGYLDTATVGVPPVSAVEAVRQSVDAWRRGQLDPRAFDPMVDRSRAAYARLTGISAEQVAIGAATSALVGLVAAALPRGATVLTATGDFTSVLFPFLAHRDRGVVVREVPLERLIDEVRDDVDLVAVSVVQSADGRVIDTAALLAAAQAHEARVLVDVTQACGWLPLDLRAVDYAVCAAYKWLLCPRGVAFLSVRPDRLADLTPLAAGWYAGADIWSSIYGSPLRLAREARRLDVSPAWFSWAGAAEALEYLADQHGPDVHAHTVGLANAFLAGLGRPGGDSAIVRVEAGGADEAFAAAGISAATRAGAVRASFHLYNDEDDVARAVRALGGR